MLAVGTFWILGFGFIGLAFLQSFKRETPQNQAAVDGWWVCAIICFVIGLLV